MPPTGRSPASAAASGELDITPDKSLFRKLGSTGYRTYEALSELVDNSIDARMSGPITVRITLDYANRSLGVTDDGVGMGLDELRDAMTIARETDYPRGKRLGMFGLGMKTACSFLGGSFTIATSQQGSDLEYAVEYDEDRWERSGSAGWKNFPYASRPKPDRQGHGTAITVSKVKIPLYAEQTTIFKKRLGERYAEYIKQGQARILVNRVECDPVSPPLAENSTRRFTIETSAGSIPAWIGLLRRRSVVGSYGIDLHYKNRLIKMHTRFGIRDHPEVAKIMGGISLDHVPVNFYKTGFITESAEYAEAEKAFRDHPAVRETVRAQRLGSRRAPADPSAVYDYLLGRTAEPPRIDPRPGRAASKRLLDALVPFEFSAGSCSVAVGYASGAGGDLYAMDRRPGRLAVTINKDSPLFSVVKNPLYLVALAVAEARAVAAAPAPPGGSALSCLEKRNSDLTRIIGGWIPADAKGPATTRITSSTCRMTYRILASTKQPAAAEAAAAREYRLSPGLDDLHSFLEVHYPHRFAFTGLSTLAQYTHNVLATPFYSLYTEKGQGRHLADTIFKCRGRYAPVINPVGSDLDLFFDLVRPKHVVVIREYAPSEIAGPLAPPARAWADLFREASRYRMPLMPEDLSATLEGLRDRRLLDRRGLESVMRRRGRPDKAQAIMKQVFAAQ